MTVSVDVYTKDDTLANDPIESVVVSVYDTTTFSLVAQAISDVTGRAAFSLPGSVGVGTSYEVRAFKLGVIFANPFLIGVVEPVVTTNKFDITGTLLTLPVATDSRLCRCTGKFTSFANTPVADLSFRISAQANSGSQVPKMLDGAMVSPDTSVFRSDEDGIVSVDLIRTGKYFVSFSGEEDVVWPITIPDRSSVNLIDLIHPAPSVLTWDPTDAPSNAVTVQVGQTVLIKYTVTLTDYRTLTTGDSLQTVIDISNSAPSTMEVGAGDAVVAVRGLVPGSGQVLAAVNPNFTPVLLPFPSLSYTALTVTVIP